MNEIMTIKNTKDNVNILFYYILEPTKKDLDILLT